MCVQKSTDAARSTFPGCGRKVNMARRCAQAVIKERSEASDPAVISPTAGIADCCPRTMRGHNIGAAAPPSSVMNSRRSR